MLLQQDIEEFKGSKVPENQDFEMSIDLYYGKMRRTWRSWRSFCRILVLHSRLQATPSRSFLDLMHALHARERNIYINGKRPDSERLYDQRRSRADHRRPVDARAS